MEENIEQRVLIALNLFASEIGLYGYTPENHQGFTKRIVEDVMQEVSLSNQSLIKEIEGLTKYGSLTKPKVELNDVIALIGKESHE